jgi:Ni/Co efflux regulator RcnB
MAARMFMQNLLRTNLRFQNGRGKERGSFVPLTKEMWMKTLLAAAASVCLILGTAAAEEQHHDRGPGSNDTTTQKGGHPDQGNATGGHMDRGRGNGGGMGQGHGGAMNGGAMNGGAMNQGGSMGGGAMNQGGSMSGGAMNHGGQNNSMMMQNQHMMQNGPNAHRNFDVKRYQRTFNAQRRFNAGTYHPPQGYNYRRWSYGQRLPAVYFRQNFWLTNFVLYGLMPPPPDCMWVRYGPDALLVDRYTGEIIQVSYGVFY